MANYVAEILFSNFGNKNLNKLFFQFYKVFRIVFFYFPRKFVEKLPDVFFKNDQLI